MVHSLLLPLLNSDMNFLLLPMRNTGFDDLVSFGLKVDRFLRLALDIRV
jgi:hypothetical protein